MDISREFKREMPAVASTSRMEHSTPRSASYSTARILNEGAARRVSNGSGAARVLNESGTPSANQLPSASTSSSITENRPATRADWSHYNPKQLKTRISEKLKVSQKGKKSKKTQICFWWFKKNIFFFSNLENLSHVTKWLNTKFIWLVLRCIISSGLNMMKIASKSWRNVYYYVAWFQCKFVLNDGLFIFYGIVITFCMAIIVQQL